VSLLQWYCVSGQEFLECTVRGDDMGSSLCPGDKNVPTWNRNAPVPHDKKCSSVWGPLAKWCLQCSGIIEAFCSVMMQQGITINAVTYCATMTHSYMAIKWKWHAFMWKVPLSNTLIYIITGTTAHNEPWPFKVISASFPCLWLQISSFLLQQYLYPGPHCLAIKIWPSNLSSSFWCHFQHIICWMTILHSYSMVN
jgi:hypothetical protein